MSWVDDSLDLLAQFAARSPVPRVRALHLPPPPLPGGMRGEFCSLELDDGALGHSYVLLGDTWAGLNQAGRSAVSPGQDALTLARQVASSNPLRRAVGLAAVNALTRCLFDRVGFVPPVPVDSIGHLDPQPGETVGMIGHFTPLIPRIVERGARLLIVELRADLVGESGAVRVTLDAAELRSCRKILATGTLLLNDTLEGMLAHCRQASHLVMIGPSVGGPPDPLLARGVTQLGGSWVLDGPAYVDALRGGRPPGAAARKFALGPADYPGWSALLDRL